MDYQIRLAQPSELDYLPAIERSAAQRYQDYLPDLGLTLDALENIVSVDFLHRAQQQHHVWVAQTASKSSIRPAIVGFIVVDRLPHGYFVVELDVSPDHGRRGIGSALVQQVLQAAQQQNLAMVTLTTFRHIPWTIPFYQRLGFEILPREDYTPEIRAIVHHESRHGFSPQVRVVMQYQIPSCQTLQQHPHC